MIEARICNSQDPSVKPCDVLRMIWIEPICSVCISMLVLTQSRIQIFEDLLRLLVALEIRGFWGSIIEKNSVLLYCSSECPNYMAPQFLQSSRIRFSLVKLYYIQFCCCHWADTTFVPERWKRGKGARHADCHSAIVHKYAFIAGRSDILHTFSYYRNRYRWQDQALLCS